MNHKLIFKVKKFHLPSAKHSGTIEEKPPGGGGGSWNHPSYHLGFMYCCITSLCSTENIGRG